MENFSNDVFTILNYQGSILFDYCKANRMNLALSYAYPRDTKQQATNRYTMNIEDIIETAEKKFGRNKINVFKVLECKEQ